MHTQYNNAIEGNKIYHGICMYTHVHAHTHAHTHMYTHTCARTHARVHTNSPCNQVTDYGNVFVFIILVDYTLNSE